MVLEDIDLLAGLQEVRDHVVNDEEMDLAILNKRKQPSDDWKELTLQWMKGINPLMNERNQPSNE